MAENKRLNDEELKNAVGGKGKPTHAAEATIIGPVLEDLEKINPSIAREYTIQGDDRVYAVSCKEWPSVAYAIASNYAPGKSKLIYHPGDRVYIEDSRSGYEIMGLVSDFE